MSVERLTRMDDEQLGRALHALEPMLSTAQTPDVAGTVTDAIRTGRRPRHRLGSRARIVIAIAAALLALAAAAAAARLVVDLGGIRIEPLPTSGVSPSGGPLNEEAFGHPIDLARARAAAGFTPVVPRTLGPPDRVWLSTPPPEEPDGVLIAMAWFPRPGLPRIPGTPFGASLIEVRGPADLVVKRVGTGFVQLHPSRAYWIHAPHELELLTGSGIQRFVVTGHVLVWQRGDLALRFEADLPRDDMLALTGLPA